jgi:hypothetical protein
VESLTRLAGCAEESSMRTNLFIRDTAECIIRILPLKIDNELGELVIMAEIVDGVLCNQVRPEALSWGRKEHA